MRKSTNPLFVQLLFLSLSSLATPVLCQEEHKNYALLPESWARQSATPRVMPSYPEEAAGHGISGVVHIKFETSTEGQVLRIKVKPRTEPLLAKAVAAAVSKWTFKIRRGPDGNATPVISRLIFNFSLGTDEPKVGLYNPGPHAPDVQSLGYYNSAKEMREWNEWQEVSTELFESLPSAFTCSAFTLTFDTPSSIRTVV